MATEPTNLEQPPVESNEEINPAIEKDIEETQETEAVQETTENDAETSSEPETEPELNFDNDPIFNEENLDFLGEEDTSLLNLDVGDLYEEEPKEDPVTQKLLSKIEELEQKISKPQDDYEDEDEEEDKKYSSLKKEIDALKKEKAEADRAAKQRELQQKAIQIEEANQGVMRKFIDSRIEPALKYMGVTDPKSLSATYIRNGVISEIVNWVESFEDNQLKGRLASPKQVDQVCKAYWKHFAKNIRPQQAQPGETAGIADKAGATPSNNQVQLVELAKEAKELEQQIEELYSKPVTERARYRDKVKELAGKLNEIKKKETELRK